MKVPSKVPSMTVIALGFAALGQTVRADNLVGAYIGGNVGIAQIDSGEGHYESQLEAEVSGFGSLDVTSATLHKDNTAWWVNAGYMLGPYVGIEADYLRFGRSYNQIAGSYVPTGASAESVIAQRRLGSEGPALGLLFRVPLSNFVDVNLRVADYYGRSSLSDGSSLNSGSHTASSQTVSASSWLLGLGVAYRVGEHWSARLDYQRIQGAGDASNVGRYDVDTVSVGLGYSF